VTVQVLEPPAASERLAATVGREPTSDEGIAEILRMEVHARGQAGRAMTIERVVRLLDPLAELDIARVEGVADSLVREGDLVLAAGGLLCATPLRAVPLPDRRARILASAGSALLRRVLGDDLTSSGFRRTMSWADESAERVAAVGGCTVSPERWAGLDLAPIADTAFLARLDARLEWEPERAGSLDREEALGWRGWSATANPPRWTSAAGARLWMAKTRFRWRRYAWTAAGESPSSAPFVTLSSDQADRARFALMREAGTGFQIASTPMDAGVALDLPAWLPVAEFRWLSLRGEPMRSEGGRTRWHVDSSTAAEVCDLLAARLGLQPGAVA
jgi:hypothetical protein